MKKIIVEAFEDPSRPQGGHAVILLRGVDAMPERPTIRLRPIEIGPAGEVRGLWRGARIEPVATRSTPQGTELVVGPDIISHPHLIAGTPVIIEVPEADVRGEFLWPGVAPLAAPRRRHVVVPRQPRSILAPPLPANDDQARYIGTADLPMTSTDGSLALSAEHANAVTAPIPEPPPLPAASDATTATSGAAGATTDGAHNLAPVAGSPGAVVPDVGELRDALAAALEAAAGAPAPPATRAASDALQASPVLSTTPARATLDTQWTSGRREGLLAHNGLLVAVAAVALLLGVAFWGLSGRRGGHAEFGSHANGQHPGGGSGGEAGSPRSGPTAATVGTTAVAAKPIACDAPSIATEPLPAGQMQLSVKAPCKGSEIVHILYGGADIVRRLDDQGALAAVVDCFAGDSDPVEVRFADGGKHVVPVKTADLERVSKIAIIWKAPVNLDLHAFEYAALPGTKGDVWSGAPGSPEAVARAVAAERKGHGFISTSADALGPGDHIEVYSFLHADEQTTGSIGLAIDYETRGDRPTESTCGQGALAVIPYNFVVLSRGGKVRHERGIIGAAECGSQLGPDVRFNQSALPVLRIKK